MPLASRDVPTAVHAQFELHDTEASELLSAPPDTFGDLDQDVLLAKTADRSVLGCMNDMAFMCEHAIAEAGGLARTDLAKLNMSLRRNINSARGYCPPIELTARRLTA